MSDSSGRAAAVTGRPGDGGRLPGKLDFLVSAVVHVLVLILGIFAFSTGADLPLTGGDEAISVRMVTLKAGTEPEVSTDERDRLPEEASPSVLPEEIVRKDEPPAEPLREPLPPEEREEVRRDVPDEPVESSDPVEADPVETEPPPADDFAAVGAAGDAGAGAPGPGTYEARVFNSVRREYRTSVTPVRSYRVVLTVFPDGETRVEVVRKSGTPAFDRAVEHALGSAKIPPMPPGRSAPAVINIEFFGPGE